MGRKHSRTDKSITYKGASMIPAPEKQYIEKIFCYKCKNCREDHAKSPWVGDGNKYCKKYQNYVPSDVMTFIRVMGCRFYEEKKVMRNE